MNAEDADLRRNLQIPRRSDDDGDAGENAKLTIRERIGMAGLASEVMAQVK